MVYQNHGKSENMPHIPEKQCGRKKSISSFLKTTVLALCITFTGLISGILVKAEEQITAEIDVETNTVASINIEPVSGSPKPEYSSITFATGGKGYFKVPITSPGTYEYIIRQTKGKDTSLIYDERTYVAVVFVKTDGTRLTYEVFAYQDRKKETKVKAIVFQNQKKEPPKPTPTPTPSPDNRRGGGGTPGKDPADTADMTNTKMYAGMLILSLLFATGSAVLLRRKTGSGI
jgi:hypothetical protein